MRTAIFALVIAAGCGGSSKSQTMAKSDAAPTCAAVADAMLAPLSEGKDQTKAMLDKKQELAGMIATRCTEDAWTEDARRCFTTVKTVDDADRCGTLLTDEQQANLKAKLGPGEPADAPAAAAEPAAEPPPSPVAVEPERDRVAPPKPKAKKATKTRKTGDPCDGGE